MIISDYSSQEVRCLADVAEEWNMIPFLSSKNADPHSLTASQIFGVDVKNEEDHPNYALRHFGKIVNFLIPYGGGAHNLAEVANIEFDRADEIIKGYYRAYPALEPYFRSKLSKAFSDGFLTVDELTMRKSYNTEAFAFVNSIDSVIGRYGKEAVDEEEMRMYRKVKGKLRRDNQNYGIQGIAATMTKIALILIYQNILAHNLIDSIKILIPVHDEILLMAEDHIAEKAKDILESGMIHGSEKVLIHTPMYTDAKIGSSWADKK